MLAANVATASFRKAGIRYRGMRHRGRQNTALRTLGELGLQWVLVKSLKNFQRTMSR